MIVLVVFGAFDYQPASWMLALFLDLIETAVVS